MKPHLIRGPWTLTVFLLAAALAAAAVVWAGGGRDEATAGSAGWTIEPLAVQRTPGGSSTADQAETPGARRTGALEGPVTMTVTGGVGGRDDKVVVEPSGAYVVELHRGWPIAGRLTVDELRAVVDAVDRADIRGTRAARSPNLCCDNLYYLFSYDGRSYESAGDMAERVATLRTLLEDLVERTQAKFQAP